MKKYSGLDFNKIYAPFSSPWNPPAGVCLSLFRLRESPGSPGQGEVAVLGAEFSRAVGIVCKLGLVIHVSPGSLVCRTCFKKFIRLFNRATWLTLKIRWRIILSYNTFFPAGGLHLCLEAKTKQKIQGCFLSSPLIFTKPNLEGVISSLTRNFSFSLRFCFDSGIDKKRPIRYCKAGNNVKNLRCYGFRR